MNKPQYITTTLPYVNAEPHVGFAMELIRADVIARYKKLMGHDVFFNTGTDEHGQKLWNDAQKAGRDIKEYVDDYASQFRGLKVLLGISDDVHFVRTTDPAHEAAAQEFWKRCDQNGYIYKKTYQVKYCVGCELEKTDSELVDGKCPIHPTYELEMINEENYFFKFSEFQKPLLDFYAAHPTFVTPDFRFHEIKTFVERGLEDFSISRLASKMPWGIPVPGDDTQVMYVWFDALVNYISTLNWPDETGNFKTFWQEGSPIQYCGKDNLRQQSAMWQAMLMAAKLPNTHQIVINGFFTGDGGIKMSKSIGNVVNPTDVVRDYGTDALRYFVTREVSMFEDSPFTIERFRETYNGSLANGLGNLVSRAMNMVVSYDVDISNVTFPDFTDIAHPAYETFELNKAVDAIWDEVRDLDLYIQANEPFKKVKVNPDEAHDDLRHVAQGIARISVLLQPVMPETAAVIAELIREKKKPEAPLFLRKE
jgi:methionyl-tRNA synthetase